MIDKLNSRKGFTLIELLVVIAIIGLLASVILASLKEARERASYSKLASEMHSVQNALELYRSDNSNYPTAVSGNLIKDMIDASLVPNNYIPSSNIETDVLTGDIYYRDDQGLNCGDPVGISSNDYLIYVRSSLEGPDSKLDQFMDHLYSSIDLSDSGYYCISMKK